MKKYLLILLLFAGCSNNNPVDSPGGGNNGTLLIDRSGIIDSVYLDSLPENEINIFSTPIDHQNDPLRIVFEYAGNSSPEDYLVNMRELSTGNYFFKFGENFSSNVSFVGIDTTVAVSPFNNTLQCFIGCSGNPANNVYFCIKDLRIYGK